MKQVSFQVKDEAITPKQALYWKSYLTSLVRVGVELEVAVPKGVRKTDLMPIFVEAFSPTKDMENLGELGVFDVVSEHCGIEIQVIGRKPYYPALLDQFKEILAVIKEYNMRIRATCGMHLHLIPIGIQEPVPAIILANVWNLTVKYAANLKYITSGGESFDALTRRRQHNSYLEMVNYDASETPICEIQKILKESKTVPEHQNFLNLEHLTFTPDMKSVTNIHYENRFPDMDICVYSIVAKIFLIQSILLRAVELSQYGVVSPGNGDERKRQKEILEFLSNNDGRLATSDTSGLTPDIVHELRTGTQEMLAFLRPVLIRFENNPSYDILDILADRPISIFRALGYDWDNIEKAIEDQITYYDFETYDIERELMICIEIGEYKGFTEPDDWKEVIAGELGYKPEEIDTKLNMLDNVRGLVWDTGVGTYLFRT